MRMRPAVALLALLALPAVGQEAYDYEEFVKRAQIALHLHGFDPGPVNGRDDGATQAALARFQLSRNLPASGSLDEQTVKELGVARTVPAQEEEENASAGAGQPIARP
jgi:peptidoglycan hydrolase-like protein with peptidoglycan-binding domain